MNNRTTRKTTRFHSAFSLPGFGTPLPPGEYLADHDEEPVEAGPRVARRRLAAFTYLPAIPVRGLAQKMVSIDPAFLEAAMEDRKQS